MLYAEVTVEPQLSWSERLRAHAAGHERRSVMTAYWIATYDEVTDPARSRRTPRSPGRH